MCDESHQMVWEGSRDQAADTEAAVRTTACDASGVVRDAHAHTGLRPKASPDGVPVEGKRSLKVRARFPIHAAGGSDDHRHERRR